MLTVEHGTAGGRLITAGRGPACDIRTEAEPQR